MRKTALLIVLLMFAVVQYGQIIADHTVVDKYEDIPQNWIDSVKTMLVDMAGQSHASGYRIGVELLELLDGNYSVSTYNNWVPDATNDLQIGSHTSTGEEHFFTNTTAISEYKNAITNQNNTSNPYDVMGFAWCYDMSGTNPPGGTEDPIHGVHWAGRTDGGPEGSLIWGLDSEDAVLTGNSVCMDTYLNAVEEYIQYCRASGYSTQFVFTTGPVDFSLGEAGMQREIKHDYIRNYVINSGGILFDYADILCWNNEEEHYMGTWYLREFSHIHPDNMLDYDASWNTIPMLADGDHIGEVGALRLGKAIWWMLARIAGWDGSTGGEDTTPPTVPIGLSLISISETSVSISWNASSDNIGVSGYNIYRSGSLIETTTGLTYTDNTVAGCTSYTYSVSALDATGNESAQSSGIAVNTCPPDVTPTLTVSPNIMHGITTFNLTVRITELNMVNTTGAITVNIPKDSKWSLPYGFETSLTILGAIPLDNSDWTYAEDATNHIFTTSEVIPAGGSSNLGLRITFNPGSTSGINPITSQVVSGGGGEIRVNNNADSERLDYFQE